MKTIKLLTKISVFVLLLLAPIFCRAMPPGTLLYRTSGNGKMYGYSGDPLMHSEKGIIKNVYSGHVAIYIGKENGEDYIVEAMPDGIVKTPAKYFVNRAENETFLGARLPDNVTDLQRAKIVAIAKSLVGKKLDYDFDFKKQKGPDSGEWTCVGLTEKLYESANISNPNNLSALEYDPKYYAVNITPDGFDNYSLTNKEGDCFSREREFSFIARRTKLLIPAPELVGFDLGLEYEGGRYIFLPYTQFLQSSLKAVAADVTIASSFSSNEVRAPLNTTALVLRWSLINNPISSLKKVASEVKNLAVKATGGVKKLAKNLNQKLFGSKKDTEIVLDNSSLKKTASKAATSKSTAAKTSATKKTTAPKITVNKAAALLTGGNSKSSTSKTSAEGSAATTSKIAAVKKAAVSAVVSKAKTVAKSAILESVLPSSVAEALLSQQTTPSVSVSTGSSGVSGSWSGTTADNFPKLAIINQIYSTGNNDWVRLYNPTNHDFDLAEVGYRLERAKTAQDPSLVMRIGSAEDGSYPGGTTIKAHGSYLIVRDDANDFYRAQADAIAIRDDFNWSGSGYTLYLGTDAINSFEDEDIIDAVGFGPDATYFQGNAPALEITDNYILNRLNNTGNNNTDFNLLFSDDPSIILSAEIIDETATTTDDTISNDTATSTEDNIIDNATSTDETVISEDPINTPKLALINKIYSTGDNDWVELFNPADYDFDLAGAGYRLEKTKTAEDPSLIMRIGDTEDGSYPGGTIIKAHSSYLIARDDANDYHKNQADAIAIRDDFSWTGSGYTLYLGTDAISSSTDEDIVNAVGFGPDATYFQGSAPALEITDNYILNRIANNENNNTDFNLLLSADPNIVSINSEIGQPDLFISPTPIQSESLTNLWHFDECHGEGEWDIGKWDCARRVGFYSDKISVAVEPAADINTFSVSFYYHKAADYSRLNLYLFNTDNEGIRLILEPNMATIEGLPNSQWRYYPNIPFDDLWHQATLVVNQAEDYWALYIDGQEVTKESFFARLPIMTDMEISGNSGPALIDELAIWKRALTPEEILTNYSNAAPFAPWPGREPQKAAKALHLWKFEEDTGVLAADSIGNSTINVLSESWAGRSHNNYALTTSYGQDLTADFSEPLTSKDLSLTLWWRNSSYPNPGRANIYLLGGQSGETNLFSLLTDYYRVGFWYNGAYGTMIEGINKAIPYDDAWHQLALVYDSYRYKLNFFVDGEFKANQPVIWIEDGEEITHLKITSDSYSSEIDDLEVWEGALSASQIKAIYANTK
jgi:hypothetical protein